MQRHLDLHRPGLGQQSLRPRPVPRVPAVAAGRIVLAVDGEMMSLFSSTADSTATPLVNRANRLPPGQLQTLGVTMFRVSQGSGCRAAAELGAVRCGAAPPDRGGGARRGFPGL